MLKNLLVIDGKDNCSVLIEAVDNVVADLLADFTAVDVAVKIKPVDWMVVCVLLIEDAEVCSIALEVVMDSNSTLANAIGVVETILVTIELDITLVDVTDGAEAEMTIIEVCSLLDTSGVIDE